MQEIYQFVLAILTTIWISAVFMSRSMSVLGAFVEIGLCIQISSYTFSFLNERSVDGILVTYGYAMIMISTIRMLLI